MPRTKMMLLTVVIVALAVPSIWAQNMRRSTIERPQPNVDGSAVCIAVPIGNPPAGYYASTNKCSSGNLLQDPPDSANGFATTCADMGGVEATYDQPISAVATPAFNGWPSWRTPGTVGGTEANNPPIYASATSIASEIGLTLTNPQGVLGLEVSNRHTHLYTVTFHTTAGDVSQGPALVGGPGFPPNPGPRRFVAVCSGPAITGVTAQCDDCTVVNGDGDTAVAQIRGDLFKGF